ncbi:MAG: hypothetical protein Q8R32_03620 [bacterium]|nr:hypothetical protein [bacterium]
MAGILRAGIFPHHRFVFLDFIDRLQIEVNSAPFNPPAFAHDVFEELVRRMMAGKSLTRGDRNILQVHFLLVIGNAGIVLAQRCDYAAYLGLALSAETTLPDGSTLAQRFGGPLYKQWANPLDDSVAISFPPLGCTLGLCGICVSRDRKLITKKKEVVTHTGTDYGRRLHFGASQIRFDYDDPRCYADRGNPDPAGQLRVLLETREATRVIAEASTIRPLGLGIFLKDHHPEAFYEVSCDLPATTIVAEARKALRFEGEIEAIPLDDIRRLGRILHEEEEESVFADHHAGGLIALLHKYGQEELIRPFLPTEPLPASFS